jgi:molybdenum transport protein
MTTLDDRQLLALLQDDGPGGDLTTHSLGIGAQMAQLCFCARQPMTLCAAEEAVRLFELAGASAFAAAATAAIVAQSGGVAVAATRKNVPGTKALSIKAVKAGGGILHRLGLSETLLVFAEHRLFLTEAPKQTIMRLRRSQPEKKIVVEVANQEEALVWTDAGADVLQLEKFTPQAVVALRAALVAAGGTRRPLLAAAGGVSAANAAAYVAAGADFLVTSAPYTAAPKDVQVNFSLAP